PQDTNGNVGTQDTVDAGKEVFDQQYIVLPLWSSISSIYKSSDDKPKDDTDKEASDAADALRKEFEQGCMDQRGVTQAGSTNSFNTISNPVNAASTSETFSAGGLSSPHPDAFIPINTLLHVYKNKKDERGIVVRNKARLVAQGHIQEEWIDYDEVFAPVAKKEAIRIFLAFASFMGFIVYQMDVKSAFLYGIIEEEVYVSQPPDFIDPQFPNKVYKVEKALYGLHQAPRALQGKYAKGLRLLVKDYCCQVKLMLLENAIELRLLEQSAAVG
nr:copia protein [Tanacetum cinerariifolium]